VGNLLDNHRLHDGRVTEAGTAQATQTVTTFITSKVKLHVPVPYLDDLQQKILADHLMLSHWTKG
jgi:hypothetical protein